MIGNYTVDDWMTKRQWPLEVAISLINGQEPEIKYICNNQKDIPTETFAPNFFLSRTASLFLSEIDRGNNEVLKWTAISCNPTSDEICVLEDYINKAGANTDKEFIYNNTKVNPKEFLKWAKGKGINIYNDVRKYLEYSFWLNKVNWIFDEAVIVIFSDECPLPYEIENTLESTKWHDRAEQLRILLADSFKYYQYSTNEYIFGKDTLLGYAHKQGLIVSAELKDEIEIRLFSKRFSDSDSEKALNADPDYKLWLSYDMWSVEEGLKLFAGIDPKIKIKGNLGILSDKEESFSDKEKSFWNIHEIFVRTAKANIIEFTSVGNREDYLDYKISPKLLIEWALSKNIKIPADITFENIVYIESENSNPPIKQMVKNLYEWSMPIYDEYYKENKKSPSREYIAKLLKQRHKLDYKVSSIVRELSAKKLSILYQVFKSGKS